MGGAPRRDAVHTAPGALPRAGSDAAGGAAGDGAYRNVLPHLGAQGRHAAPSRVPGSSGGLVGRAAEAGTARDVAGAFSPAAHTSLRALPSHRGQLPEFPSASNRPGRAVVEGEKVAGSGHEGDSYRGVTGPLAIGRVTPWLLGRQRRPRLPLARPPLPQPPRRPATECCCHQARNQLNIWASCKVVLPALARLCRVFGVTHRLLSYSLSCGMPAISDRLAGHCPGAPDPGPPRVPERGSKKTKPNPAQRPGQPTSP